MDNCPVCGVEYPEGEPLLCDCWMLTKEQEEYILDKEDLLTNNTAGHKSQ